jgi:PAS domain S-box-containing protein
MSLHFNAFSVLLLMSGVGTLLIAFLILHGATTVVKWFAAVMFCVTIWGIAYSFELSSHTLGQMLFWIRIEYIGISFLPAMWIFFIVKFIGKNEWLTILNRVIIIVFPIATLLLVWTNSWHHLHYENVHADSSGPFPLLAITPGPGYYVHTIYFYFMLALGIALLISKFSNTEVAFRRQRQAILLGACLPWLVNFAYLLGVRPFHHIDLTPYAFIVTSVSIAYGLFRYRLFNVMPLAREKVMEAIREGILVLDGQGRVVDMNPAMRVFLPSYMTEIIGEAFADILPQHEQLHELVGRETGTRAELEIGDRSYEVAVTRLFDKRRNSGGVTLIFWDITERKKYSEKIEQQAQELRDLNAIKNRIFSIVAHDLRGPIASLAAILDMVENSRASGEEFKAMVSMISRNVDYTSAMLENLLYWSMSQLEGHYVTPGRFDLTSMVRNKLALYEKRANDKKIILADKVDEGTFLFADPDMIGVVLRNLISNAIKFCNCGDTITISTAQGPDTITVCIADTGTGIDPERIGKLFSSETVTTRGTQNEKGTGLGLKLCKEFVEKNHGTFWLESVLKKGSRFYFRLAKG